jgi:DNA-binding Lrp family transcriptional regulator
VLLCIAQDPGIRLREIGDQVGITERGAYSIVTELAADGYISRERAGRRNRYRIHAHLPLPDGLAHKQRIGDLLAILTAQDPASIDAGSVQRQHRAHAPGEGARLTV